MDLEDFGTSSAKPPKSNRKQPRASAATALESSDDDEELFNAIHLTQWAICGQHLYRPVSVTYPKLFSGVYSIMAKENLGIVFEKKNMCIDDLLRFPDSVSEKILNDITTFWNRGDKFKEHGFLHRRGYLLYGPTGSGKTCLVQQIIADIIENDGLVFQCDHHPSIFSDGLALFRKVEPDRPVVCLFEDIDTIIDEYSEDDILALLDGENQINKVLNIATTNYPEKLDKRLVARPRRFDQVVKVDMPSAQVRKMYFAKKLKVSEEELDMWVAATNNFSFAACAELVISVCCFGNKFETAVKLLEKMMTATISSNDYRYSEGNGPGFAKS